MYSLKNVLTQSPDKVKSTVLAVLGVAVIIATYRGYDIGGDVVAAIGIAIERVLDLFYVAPVKVAQEEVALSELHDHTLQAIELGQKLPRKAA
jgi:hypothetical protein